MKRFIIAACCACIIGLTPHPLQAEEPLRAENDPATETKPRQLEMSISSRSVPGWKPSVPQIAQAVGRTHLYFNYMDKSEYAKAYDMIAPETKSIMPAEMHQKMRVQEAQSVGAMKSRDYIKVTWTKLPENTPGGGVYAAVDVDSVFENADKYCGYLVLYQKNDNAPFLIMRDERNYIPNNVMAKQTPEQQAESWKKISSFCPNTRH